MTIAQQLNIKTFPFSIKDEKGIVIYSEYSNGFWVKWEHNENGITYLENSDGYWDKWEYDEGVVIYSENSKGEIIDNRPPKVVEIEGIKYKLVKL